MTRPVVTKHLHRSINWCGDARSAADQWMANYFECRLDLINESFEAEFFKMQAILGWVAAACFFIAWVLK